MNQSPGGTIVDRDNLLENLGGDRELLLEVLGIFASEARKLFSAVRDAAKCNNAASLEHSAHSLKGSMSIFGARAIVEVSQKLELMGRNHDLANADDCCSLLELELARLGIELAQIERDIRAEDLVF
jgi:two-component system, sensor histidine kinase and response regulator